jgi:glycosyltransferase involved in cell wall biosynthesis
MKTAFGNTSNPLVSVILITYNSSCFVVETLDSIKTQTYKNIELIISDDGSIDNTLCICNTWLRNNKERFVRTKVVSVEKNTGIPKNCNRGVTEAKGEWLKLIAGDDVLIDDCIMNNIKFISSAPNIEFCFSDIYSYKDNFLRENLIFDDGSYDLKAKKFSELSNVFQLQVIARGSLIKAPTLFLNKLKLQNIGNFDESYPFLEDWTTYHNWLQKGYKIHYLPKKTIKYRVNNESIQNFKNELASFSVFTLKLEKVIKDNFLQYYTLKEKILFYLEYSYYRYYYEKRQLNLFEKSIQRIWYIFVGKSINNRKKVLDKYFDLHKKQLS